MQLPMEERAHPSAPAHRGLALAVRMGGRAAELLVYGDLSTGASNDLVGNTELARKMVREWGMSDKIGPMAWGSQGQVFLGEDLMHTRDYSEHTSQVIDDEVEIILRAQEQRALEVLARHRGGLDAVARALLDEETIDGETVGRLVDTAYGRPVHAKGSSPSRRSSWPPSTARPARTTPTVLPPMGRRLSSRRRDHRERRPSRAPARPPSKANPRTTRRPPRPTVPPMHRRSPRLRPRRAATGTVCDRASPHGRHRHHRLPRQPGRGPSRRPGPRHHRHPLPADLALRWRCARAAHAAPGLTSRRCVHETAVDSAPSRSAEGQADGRPKLSQRRGRPAV